MTIKVKFPNGYRGRETNEIYIPPGMEYEIPDEERHLIDVGLAVEVTEPEPEDKPKRRGRKAATEEGA